MQVYKALGYQVARIDILNGEYSTDINNPYRYTDSHATVDVVVEDLSCAITQDATYNYAAFDMDGNGLSALEIRNRYHVDGEAINLQTIRVNTDPAWNDNASAPTSISPTFANHLLSYYRVVYSWLDSGSTHSWVTMSEFLPNPVNEADIPGAFPSLGLALSAVMTLREQGLDWQASADALRENGYVAGFRFYDASGSVESEWLTVGVYEGKCLSINYQTGAFIEGRLDQIIDDATGGGRNLRAGVDLEGFTSAVELLMPDGTLIPDWLTRLEDSYAIRNAVDFGTTGENLLGGGQGWHLLFDRTDTNVVVVGTSVTAAVARGTSGNDTLVFYNVNPDTNVHLAENGFEWAQHIRVDQGDAGWALSIRDFAQSWELAKETTTYDNGRSVGVRHDWRDASDWKTITSHYDIEGRQTVLAATYDNGTGYKTFFDADGSSDWTEYTDTTDAQGHLVNRQASYDDGSGYKTYWDAADASSWHVYTDTTSTDGQLKTRVAKYDDGSGYKSFWELAGASWDWYTDYLTSSGELEARVAVYDDGSGYTTHWDVNNHSWTMYTDYFDTEGRLFVRYADYDDGRSYASDYDVNDIYTWSITTTWYDAHGDILRTYYTNDDGSTWGI